MGFRLADVTDTSMNLHSFLYDASLQQKKILSKYLNYFP